ncbi:hypothetical protein ACLMJK_002791 [Lecanora helva]
MAFNPLTPNANALTLNNSHSMLEGIFRVGAGYTAIQTSLLKHFHNDDFDVLRRLSPIMAVALNTPSGVQGEACTRRSLRHQADLVDRCDELGMAAGFGKLPNGSVSVSPPTLLPCIGKGAER